MRRIATQRQPSTHTLKTQPEPFEAVWSGEKVHEFRKDDRGFRVGDFLCLREFYAEANRFTNRQIGARITHVSHAPAWGIPEGFVVMSIRVLSKVLR